MAEHIADLAASFRRHVRAEGRSERTATVYGQAIRFHSAWLVAQGRTATLDELSRAGIRNWLSELADVLEPSTVRTRYKGLRRFCRWLVAEGELEVDPMVGLEVPHVVDRPVPVL
nr:phage integrase N-terminal SAM-like domain-containing protein [Nocardioidaceae bacterium]